MTVIPGLPPELKRLATVYEFISPEQFARLGIDPEDVPLGSFPAHNHPPFLPDRFGGNAYGLGLFEYSALSPDEARILEDIDFSNSGQISGNYSQINDMLKRLGLLIRFTAHGLPFYLIPRQYIIHFSAEIQAKADWIEQHLQGMKTRETAGVGIIANQASLLLSELQTRLPRFNFIHLDSMEAMQNQPAPLQAVIMLDPPMEIDFLSGGHKKSGFSGDSQYNTGYFVAGRVHDLLDKQGLLLIVCDSPNFGSDQLIKVQFRGQDEFKRFLLFSHMYHTRQRYNSCQDLSLTVHSSDFYTFLTAQGLYYESMESMLGGRHLPQVTPPEIDALPYQDITLPLPPNNGAEQQSYWRSCFAPYFSMTTLDTILPALQEKFWNEKYSASSSWPQTLLVGIGQGRSKPVKFADLEEDPKLKFLIGCPRQLLAPYKNTFAYVLKTLDVVRQIYHKQYPGLSARGQRMLLGAFEGNSAMVQSVKRLINKVDELKRMEQRINPQGILGVETPVLENLEKLGLLGLDRGVLGQLYLTVLGHSSLGRVCLGKLSEQTLAPLADVGNYANLEEAISTINLCRLFSYAETASSDYIAKHSNLMAELFAMSLTTTRVVTDPYTSWEDIEKEREYVSGGLKNLVVVKLLKLLNLFDFIGNWPLLVEAGPYQQEVLTDFDHATQEKAAQVLTLHAHVLQFLETFYVNDSHSQPYFFRALLACHVHGVSRLLPRLGAKAAFNLLWLCVHISDVRIINLNLLPSPHNPDELSRFNKLRQNLENMPLSALAPSVLNDLRQSMLGQKEVYVQGTGVYFTLDAELGVLAPSFLDPAQTLHEFSWEALVASKQSLERCSPQQLKLLDQTYNSLDRYFKASLQDSGDFAQIRDNLLRHLMSQLLVLPEFAQRFQRLVLYCPHLLQTLFYKPEAERKKLPLRAALKLDAVLKDRLEAFQNMQFSYEAAVAEFGPSATGTVGVSKLQFVYLAQKLQAALNRHPSLPMGIIISILFSAKENASENLPAELTLYKDMLPDEQVEEDLKFLLAAQHLPWLIISGQAPMNHLQMLLQVENTALLNASFILAIIYTACKEEGFLDEDLLEQVLVFWRRLETWRNGQYDAEQAYMEQLQRYCLFRRALDKYLTEKESMGVLPSLEDLHISPEHVNPPEQEACHQLAMDRLLRLCGFYFVETIDVQMFSRDTPAVFIYRNKRLRSHGLASFSRELEAALELAKETDSLLGAFVLDSLSDYERPLQISNFTAVASKLEPAHRLNLLALGLLAWQKAYAEGNEALELNYQNLANLDSFRLDLLQHILTNSNLSKLLHNDNLKDFSRYIPGITVTVENKQVSLELAGVVRLSKLVQSFAQINSIKRLNSLYNQEVKYLDEVWPEAVSSFREHLDQAFQMNLNRLVDNFLDKARMAMRTAKDMETLAGFARKYRRQASAMPERCLAMLGDLYAFNVHRMQAGLLQETAQRLAQVNSLAELDMLWHETIPQLARPEINEQDNSLNLSLAAFFDRRARELGQ